MTQILFFDPKCLPAPQRSLIPHPGAALFALNSLSSKKSISSHPPVPVFSAPIAFASAEYKTLAGTQVSLSCANPIRIDI
jgi:hypothetical protein